MLVVDIADDRILSIEMIDRPPIPRRDAQWSVPEILRGST